MKKKKRHPHIALVERAAEDMVRGFEGLASVRTCEHCGGDADRLEGDFALKPMREITHEDNATRVCPCGARVTISEESDASMKWTAEHRPHTNGKMIVTSDGSWAKFYTSKPKDYEVEL